MAVLENRYWTHEKLNKIEGVGNLNVLNIYKREVIERA